MFVHLSVRQSPQALSGLKSALSGLESARADFRPERTGFRPEKADFRLERPERADFRPERAWGGLMKERTDKLCSTGLCALWGRCPKISPISLKRALPSQKLLNLLS